MSPQPRRPSIDELAAAPIDDQDERALHALAALYEQLDPLPDDLVERLKFGITLDALHAEIAQLQRSTELTGVRGDDVSQAQTVTFTSPSATAMVSIAVLPADRVRVDGWLAPAGPVEVELRLVGQAIRVLADDEGRFVFADVSRGLAQFVLRRLDGSAPPVITPSIQL